jgi:hypothetical protein
MEQDGGGSAGVRRIETDGQATSLLEVVFICHARAERRILRACFRGFGEFPADRPGPGRPDVDEKRRRLD